MHSVLRSCKTRVLLVLVITCVIALCVMSPLLTTWASESDAGARAGQLADASSAPRRKMTAADDAADGGSGSSSSARLSQTNRRQPAQEREQAETNADPGWPTVEIMKIYRNRAPEKLAQVGRFQARGSGFIAHSFVHSFAFI